MFKFVILPLLSLTFACTPAEDYKQPSSPDPRPQTFSLPSPAVAANEVIPPWQAVTIACWLNPSPKFSDKSCDGTSFPYTVPAGRGFCLTHLALFNKFPFNPSQYGGDMRSMYFVLYSDFGGWTTPAHHPEYDFRPSIGPFPAGTVIRASILNNMNEDQNTMAWMGGWLLPAGQRCDF